MTLPSTITIDGPVAAGKSTVGHMLARHLHYLYFDTGCMYRAITVVILRQGMCIEDEATISSMAATISIDIKPPTVNDGRQYTVLVNGEDITWEIRSPEVDAQVSEVAAYSRVRTVLTTQMRTIGQRGQLVMVGRDIGTVVMPDAQLKLYIDASLEERAQRRHNQNLARGLDISYEDVLNNVKLRDQTDSLRHSAPLRAAADAHIIDTGPMDLQEVLAEVLALTFSDTD